MFTSQLFRFWEQMCPDVLKCFNIMIVSYFGNCSIWKRVTASDSGFRVTRQKKTNEISQIRHWLLFSFLILRRRKRDFKTKSQQQQSEIIHILAVNTITMITILVKSPKISKEKDCFFLFTLFFLPRLHTNCFEQRFRATHPFIHSFIHSLSHSFICSPIHLFI